METLFLKTRMAAERNESIALAAEALRHGKLVAFPTETVYGLGANIFLERAVRRIFTVKRRPADNPLIVHVSSSDQALDLLLEEPRWFRELTSAFWPGALTLVAKRNAAVLDCVTTGLDTVAVRMPDHPLALRLIRAAGVPLAAPSANISGRPSPTTAKEVFADLQGKIYAVLDGGVCRLGIESTVLDLTKNPPVILRPGIVTAGDIEAVTGVSVRHARQSSSRPSSPGMKYTHYAPTTPLTLVLFSPALERRLHRFLRTAEKAGQRIGVMAPKRYSSLQAAEFYSLGEGTPVEYARHLYHALRSLDRLHCDGILCPGVPESGVGIAVMNRLRKAASRILR